MLLLNMAEQPNMYAAIIALIQMLGTAFAVWIAYRQTVLNNRRDASALAVKVEETTAKTASKLDEVHVAVNGNLDAAKKKAEKYAAKLRAHGLDPDND